MGKKDEQVGLLEQLSAQTTVNEMQMYFQKVLSLRGFNNQAAKDKLLLLLEEVGELAKALRKDDSTLSIDRTRIQNYDSVESEMADVFIVLISMANVLNIRLIDAVIEKEKQNIERIWN